jgi:transcription initiation factor TFIID TATA-box-binding protein
MGSSWFSLYGVEPPSISLEYLKQLQDEMAAEMEEDLRNNTVMSKQRALEAQNPLFTYPNGAPAKGRGILAGQGLIWDEALGVHGPDAGEDDGDDGEDYDDDVRDEEEEDFGWSLHDERRPIPSRRITPGTRVVPRNPAPVADCHEGFLKSFREMEASEAEKFRPAISIKNVVMTVFSNQRMQLDEIASRNRSCWYNPEVFAALQTKITDRTIDLNATLLIFSSGKIIVTGLEKLEQARIMYHSMLPEFFNKRMGLNIQLGKFVIQNIVAKSECVLQNGTRFALDIQALRDENSCHVSLMDDLFPGAIYPMENPKLMILLFKSGNIVLTGAKKQEDLNHGIYKLYREVCLKYARPINGVSTSSVYSLSTRRSTDLYKNTITDLVYGEGTELDTVERFRSVMCGLKNEGDEEGTLASVDRPGHVEGTLLASARAGVPSYIDDLDGFAKKKKAPGRGRRKGFAADDGIGLEEDDVIQMLESTIITPISYDDDDHDDSDDEDDDAEPTARSSNKSNAKDRNKKKKKKDMEQSMRILEQGLRKLIFTGDAELEA